MEPVVLSATGSSPLAPWVPYSAYPFPSLVPAIDIKLSSEGAKTAGKPLEEPSKANGPEAAKSRVESLGKAPSGLTDSMHQDEDSPFKSLFDSLHPRPTGKEKKWYEKLTIRGYSQVRFGRALDQNALGADPFLFGDRSINGKTDNFSIRRARMIISGDINEHLLFYFQSDFANNPADNTNNTFFAQIRDLYGDIYLDPDKINRLRVGQSKLPWGFEEMQSSGNRVPLDRSDAIDSGDSPNQRDLGIFYYWTPVAKQKLLKELVDGGLKGTGNYGIFALGIYNGQGGSELEQNLNLNTVARVTWPFQLPSGQVVETSLQGYTGQVVVDGASIRPLGQGDSFTPLGTGGNKGFRNQRLAASFVWYPQPFGVQTEWNVGQAPGLNGAQTAIQVRSLEGGYIMAMYKIDTAKNGIFIPYTRYQHYQGSYPSIANSPYGTNDKLDAGVEWQIWKGMEVVMEYSLVNGINLNAIDMPGAVSYRNFQGSIIRCQLQINY